MAGTAELHTPDSNGKLAVLVERSEQTKAFVELANKELHALTEITNRIERTLIQNTEQLTARSEANTVAIKNLTIQVDHRDQSSIARDQQQVGMIHAEENARQAADEMLNQKHDKDVADINAKIDKITDKLGDVFVTNRIILFLTAGAVLAVIYAVVSGRLGLVIHP